MALSRKTRNQIADLSTSGIDGYYTSPAKFFGKLDWTLRQSTEGLQMADDYPQTHIDEGRGRIAVSKIGMEAHPLFDVTYTWHKMPSGNWEIICYASC